MILLTIVESCTLYVVQALYMHMILLVKKGQQGIHKYIKNTLLHIHKRQHQYLNIYSQCIWIPIVFVLDIIIFNLNAYRSAQKSNQISQSCMITSTLGLQKAWCPNHHRGHYKFWSQLNTLHGFRLIRNSETFLPFGPIMSVRIDLVVQCDSWQHF